MKCEVLCITAHSPPISTQVPPDRWNLVHDIHHKHVCGRSVPDLGLCGRGGFHHHQFHCKWSAIRFSVPCDRVLICSASVMLSSLASCTREFALRRANDFWLVTAMLKKFYLQLL